MIASDLFKVEDFNHQDSQKAYGKRSIRADAAWFPSQLLFIFLVGCSVSPSHMQGGSNLAPGTGESPMICWKLNGTVYPFSSLCHSWGFQPLPRFPVHLTGMSAPAESYLSVVLLLGL